MRQSRGNHELKEEAVTLVICLIYTALYSIFEGRVDRKLWHIEQRIDAHHKRLDSVQTVADADETYEYTYNNS